MQNCRIVSVMKSFASLWLTLVKILVVLGQFKSQFIGSFVSKSEQARRNFCGSKQCLVDSEILFLAASQNESVNPCDDFKEFTLGNFIKYRALNDRYQYRGLQADLDDIFREKLRKVMNEKTENNIPRVFRILKNYFANCVSSSE